MEWGNLNFFKRAFEEYNISGLDYMLEPSGRSAIVSLAIGDIPVHSQPPKMRMAELKEEFSNISQSINLPISISEGVTAERGVVQQNGLKSNQKQPQVRNYPKMTFSFSTDLSMEDWLSVFNKFPALEILNLQFDPNSNTWTYEGQIYEKIF